MGCWPILSSLNVAGVDGFVETCLPLCVVLYLLLLSVLCGKKWEISCFVSGVVSARVKSGILGLFW